MIRLQLPSRHWHSEGSLNVADGEGLEIGSRGLESAPHFL